MRLLSLRCCSSVPVLLELLAYSQMGRAVAEWVRLRLSQRRCRCRWTGDWVTLTVDGVGRGSSVRGVVAQCGVW